MGISSRDKILNTIKRGIYRPGDEKTDAPESIFHKEADLHNYRRETRTAQNLVQESENLIENFMNELTKVNGIAKVINNEDQIKEYLSNLTAESNSKSFLVWETALIKKLKVIEYLESNGLRLIKSHDKEQLAKADIGITEADYAIADSGTLVLFSNPKKPRLVSLIAPVHIAILESKKIVHNIFQLFQIVKHEYHQEMRGKNPMRCLTFITGPSRTADIELNLTLGVHGPKEVHILIYNK
ncbi:MAG TPA: lactate utilization protein [Thermodesulfobacteriota bacterium]